MKGRFQNFKIHVSRWGWPRTLLRVGVDAIGWMFGIHVVYVRVREVPAASGPPEVPRGMELREIDAGSLRRLAREGNNMHLDADFVDAALNRGDVAFGAFQNANLVGYVWRSIREAPHDGDVWVRVRSPYCYSYKAFTLPEHRGKRIAPALMLFADSKMYERGFTHRAGFIEMTNFASLSMSDRTDSRIIGSAAYISKFGAFHAFRSRSVSDTGFEFFQRTGQGNSG